MQAESNEYIRKRIAYKEELEKIFCFDPISVKYILAIVDNSYFLGKLEEVNRSVKFLEEHYDDEDDDDGDTEDEPIVPSPFINAFREDR